MCHLHYVIGYHKPYTHRNVFLPPKSTKKKENNNKKTPSIHPKIEMLLNLKNSLLQNEGELKLLIQHFATERSEKRNQYIYIITLRPCSLLLNSQESVGGFFKTAI